MTIKTIAFALAAAVTLPIAAQAGSGADQLARSLGVEPGVYSLTQLSKAAGYASEDSSTARQQIAFILGSDAGGTTVFTTRSAPGAGLGVFPQDFGTSNPHSLND